MQTATSKTKVTTPKLSEIARRVAAPKSAVSTGWPAVANKCRDLGITFRPWQPGVGRLILAKRDDGKYAATIGGTGLAIPRQVGKTFLVGAIIFALCLLRPNLTVIWTSHRLRTSEETFKKMQAFTKRKRIAPHIRKVTLGSGEESIEFRNGSRILFGARERGFGRGFDEVDVLIFDEAQILSENALDDMIPATNQSRQETSALLLFMGTPPKPTDPSEVFLRMRHEALTGEDADTGWVEFGADPDHVFTALPAPLSEADWKQIAKANPSFPEDTPREAILRMRKKLGEGSFRREGAGIFDEDELTPTVISAKEWEATGLEPDGVPTEGVRSLGVKFSLDGSRVAVCGALKTDGLIHIELVGAHSGSMNAGTASLVTWVAGRWKNYAAITVDGLSHAGAFVDALIAAGVSKKVIVTPSWPEVATGNAMLLEAVIQKTMTHLDTEGQKMLDDSVAACTKKLQGTKGAWSWLSMKEPGDEVPISAAALAHLGAKTSKRQPGRTMTVGVM